MVVSNIFYFHPYLGKIPILTNIFQRGWFNHQLDIGCTRQDFFALLARHCDLMRCCPEMPLPFFVAIDDYVGPLGDGRNMTKPVF